MPERKRTQFYDGTRYVTRCEKDMKAYFEASLKRRLP